MPAQQKYNKLKSIISLCWLTNNVAVKNYWPKLALTIMYEKRTI
jgi:hypothetical protein